MTNTGGIAGEQLRSFIERIERLEEEKKGITEDIAEVKAAAKAMGFDPKIINKVLALRKMDQADRQEQEALLDVYLHAVEGGETYTIEGIAYSYQQLKEANWTDEQIGQLV